MAVIVSRRRSKCTQSTTATIWTWWINHVRRLFEINTDNFAKRLWTNFQIIWNVSFTSCEIDLSKLIDMRWCCIWVSDKRHTLRIRPLSEPIIMLYIRLISIVFNVTPVLTSPIFFILIHVSCRHKIIVKDTCNTDRVSFTSYDHDRTQNASQSVLYFINSCNKVYNRPRFVYGNESISSRCKVTSYELPTVIEILSKLNPKCHYRQDGANETSGSGGDCG